MPTWTIYGTRAELVFLGENTPNTILLAVERINGKWVATCDDNVEPFRAVGCRTTNEKKVGTATESTDAMLKVIRYAERKKWVDRGLLEVY